MAYKIVEKKSGEVKLEIEVEKKLLLKVTDLVVSDLAKTVKVDGFRPGKAPQFVIEKEVGKDRFWAEVMDKAIPEAFYEAVIAEKLVTISAPQIQVKEFIPGEKILYEATVAVLPEIKDLHYKDLKIKEIKEVPIQKEKDDALLAVLKRSSEEVEVKRAARKGDRVEIDFEGTLKGLPFDGGKSQNHPVVLGSGMLVPGFEEKIEGHTSGDEFEIDVTFPADYHAANLAGEKARFKVKLNKVSEIVEPKADDAWAKKVGFPDLKKLKEELERQLEMEKNLENKRKTEEQILAKIIEKGKIEAPQTLTAEEIHRMVHEAEHNLSILGLTMDQFLEMSKKSLSDMEEEMKPEAQKRVKIGIILGEIARIEDVKVEEKEIDAEIDKIVSMSGPEVPRDDVKAAYDMPEIRREIGNNIIIRKVMDKLWDLNVVK